MTGQLVVFEGINGAGKSSLIAALAADDTRPCVVVRSRGPGSRTQRLVERHPTSLGMTAMVIWARWRWLEPLRRAGVCVLADRGLLSEATHLPNARRRVNRLLFAVARRLYRPADLLVVVDTPAELARERIVARDGDDAQGYIKSLPALAQRRELMRSMAAKLPGRQLLLDGSQPTATLAATVRTALEWR